MKKTVAAAALTAVMLMGLAGCGKVPEPSRDLDGIRKDDKPVAAVSNDTLYNVSREKVIERTGVELNAPEEAEDIEYNILCADTEAPIAEMKYSFKKYKVMLRAAKPGLTSLSAQEAGEYNIGGLYYNFAEPVETSADGFRAYAFISGEASYVAWLNTRTGVLYNFCVTGLIDMELLQKQLEYAYPIPEETEEEVSIPDSALNEDLRLEVEALMNAVYEIAPDTAGSGLRAAAAAAMIMDFSEKYQGDFNTDALRNVIGNWFNDRFYGDEAYIPVINDNISTVRGLIAAFLNDYGEMDRQLSDSGYARQYAGYTNEYVDYVMEIISGAVF